MRFEAICTSPNRYSIEEGTQKDCPQKRPSHRLAEDPIPHKKRKWRGNNSSASETQDVKHGSGDIQAANRYVDIRASNGTNSKCVVDVSHKFQLSNGHKAAEGRLEETDAHRLNWRQKQIDFGKNTLGYEHYLKLVPRNERKPSDPQTPDIKKAYSKRRWDGLLRQWRRRLHAFDPPLGENEENPDFFSFGGKSQSNSPKQQKNEAVLQTSSVGTDNDLTIYDDWIPM